MKRLALTLALAGLAAPNSAYAASFEGAFLGLNVGYSFGEIEYQYEDGITGNGDFSDDTDLDGFEGGVFAGFRHHFTPHFNLGIEAGFMLSGSEGSFRETIAGTDFALEYEKENEIYVSLKPGFLVDDNTLAYGVVGYQRADFSAGLLIDGASLGSEDDDFDGYHLGAGLEHTLDNGLSVRGEYRYNNYLDNEYSYEDAQQDSLGGNESVVRVGVAYSFNAMTP